MITIDTFLTNITPLNFFETQDDATNYYNAVASGLYEIAGAFLQFGFKNYSILAVNRLLDLELMDKLQSYKPDLKDMDILNFFDDEFLVELIDLEFFKEEGTYHVYNLFKRNQDDPTIIELNKEEYFLMHLLSRLVSSDNSIKYVNKLYSKVLNNTLYDLGTSSKMFILIKFLEQLQNKPQIITDYLASEDSKVKYLNVISFYFTMWEVYLNDSLLTSNSFQAITSKESYDRFFSLYIAKEKFTNLLNALYLVP
jgi:hypothetical protein